MLRFLATRRFWKRLAITTGVVLLLLVVAGGLVVWWVNHQWDARVAAIRTAGDPVSIADLAPEPIPDDQNAAAILESIAPQLDEFHKDYMDFIYDTPLGKAYSDADDEGEPPTADQLVAIRRIIDKYPDLPAALEQAAACSHYASLANFSLPASEFFEEDISNRLERIRTVARFNDWRRLSLLADGQPDRAAQVGLETLRLVRLHSAEPLLVNRALNNAACSLTAKGLYHTVAAGPISPELRREIDEELARHDDLQVFKRVLLELRAYAIDQMETRIAGEQGRRTIGRSMFVWWYGPGLLDEYEELITVADQPWYELQHDPESYEVKSTGNVSFTVKSTGHGALADLNAPPIEAAKDADTRATALLRALRIYNALAEYRDENGHEATGLDDLALPKEATIDPFSGEPLILRQTDDGWVVYSVGKDGVDDGGDFKGQKDYGLAPAGHRSVE